IATWITDATDQPLGRDVAQGSERTVALAQLDALFFLALEVPGESEVTDGRAAICPQHHVGGLEIVMYEPGAVGSREAAPSFEIRVEDGRRVARRHQPATQIGLGVLERQEWRAAVLTDVVD